MNTILKMLYRPVQAFRELKNSGKFAWMSLIVLLIVLLIDNILKIPVMARVLELTMASVSGQMSDEQFDASMQILHKMRYLSAIISVFSHLVYLIFYTLVIWILAMIVKPSISFLKALEMMIHCYFILAMGMLADTFILYYQGIENINNILELSLTGLNVFTSVESVGAMMYTFLMLISPFYVWFVVIMTIGLAVLAGMKYQKAFIISFIFWMLLIVYTVVTVYFSQVIMQKAGFDFI